MCCRRISVEIYIIRRGRAQRWWITRLPVRFRRRALLPSSPSLPPISIILLHVFTLVQTHYLPRLFDGQGRKELVLCGDIPPKLTVLDIEVDSVLPSKSSTRTRSFFSDSSYTFRAERRPLSTPLMPSDDTLTRPFNPRSVQSDRWHSM